MTGTVGSVFLGLTVGCARCHDHKFEALPTSDYYRLQAFFAGAKFVETPIATKEEKEAIELANKVIDAKEAPLKKRMAEIDAPYRKAIAAERKARLTPAENALLAIPEKDRTKTQKRLVEGIQGTLNITWDLVYDAVAKNPVDFAEREKIKRQIYELEFDPSTTPRARPIARRYQARSSRNVRGQAR